MATRSKKLPASKKEWVPIGTEECHSCEGTGRDNGVIRCCNMCDGTGRVPKYILVSQVAAKWLREAMR